MRPFVIRIVGYEKSGGGGMMWIEGFHNLCSLYNVNLNGNLPFVHNVRIEQLTFDPGAAHISRH